MDKQLELLINQQIDNYLNNNNEEIEMLTEDNNNKSIVKEKLITYEEEEDTDSEEEFKTGLRCTKKSKNLQTMNYFMIQIKMIKMKIG